MITEIDDLPAGAIGFVASGVVTRDDYQRVVMPAVAAVGELDLGVRLLYVFGPEFDRFEGGAMWEDAVLGFRHALMWDRIAVVSDHEWIGRAVQAFRWLLAGSVRLYPYADLAAARSWIAGDDTAA